MEAVDPAGIDDLVDCLVRLRNRGGRLFLAGNGGGAAHAAHAACDFRKLSGIESYSPSDNPASLTAWANDAGWNSSYVGWLRESRLARPDALMAISVGGGDEDRQVSGNLVEALRFAREVGAMILAVVGRDGGYAAALSNAAVIIPPLYPEHVTAHTEWCQSLVLHLLATAPELQTNRPKWESLQ